MNRWVLYGSIGAIMLASAGCVDRESQKQSKATEDVISNPTHAVVAQLASIRTLVDEVSITGTLATSLDTEVGAKTSGKITQVLVKDGDPVTVGQLIASVDSTSQMSALQQAESSLQQALAGQRSSNSSLAQAISNATLNPAKTTAAVRQAQASLRSARAQLAKSLNGSRPQERAQAVALVQSAKTSLENAQKELERVAKLVGQGALAANKLDQQQTAVASARSTYEQAVESLSMIQAGNRPEDIAVARANVQEAEESLRSAEAQKSLDVLYKDQVDAARASLESSRAQVRSAEAQVDIAQKNLADTMVKSPFTGRVQGKPLQVGSVVAAGTTVAQIIGSQGLYFSGQVPENQIGRIAIGKPVTVTVGSIPGRQFAGKVVAISPQASNVGRLFDVRVQLTGDIHLLRPGIFAQGNVQVAVYPNAVVLPQKAVVKDGDNKYVFVTDGDKARRIAVRTGLTQDDSVQVFGLPAGAQVIVQGQTSLQEGSKIRIDTGSKGSSGEA